MWPVRWSAAATPARTWWPGPDRLGWYRRKDNRRRGAFRVGRSDNACAPRLSGQHAREGQDRRRAARALARGGVTPMEPEKLGPGLQACICLLYTSDAADDLLCVDL